MRHRIPVLIFATFAVIAAGFVGPSPASAQNPPSATASTPMTTASFARAVGKTVYVTTVDGRRSKGRLQSVTPGSITLATGHTNAQIALDQVQTIKRVSHRTRNGLLIGLGVGIIPTLGPFGDSESGAATALHFLVPPVVGLAAGALVGALLDHAKRDSDLVYYKGRKPTTTFGVVPILSATRKGFALNMSWR